MSDKLRPIRAQSTTPTEEDLAWLQHAREEQRNTPARLEETAKYLTAIISISLAIFIDKRPANMADWTQGTLTVSMWFWMLAALLSFFVLFPWRYRYRSDSPEDVQRAYGQMIRVKRTLLVISIVLFLVALGIGVVTFLYGWDWSPAK